MVVVQPPDHRIGRNVIPAGSEEPPDRLPESLADEIPEGQVDRGNPEQRQPGRAVVIVLLPEPFPDSPDEEGIIAGDLRPHRVVDQQREDLGRGVDPPEVGARFPADALIGLDPDPHLSIGVQRLERIADRCVLVRCLGRRRHPRDLHRCLLLACRARSPSDRHGSRAT